MTISKCLHDVYPWAVSTLNDLVRHVICNKLSQIIYCNKLNGQN